MVSVDVREERTNHEVSSSSEEEDCRIKELDLEDNSEGTISKKLALELLSVPSESESTIWTRFT